MMRRIAIAIFAFLLSSAVFADTQEEIRTKNLYKYTYGNTDDSNPQQTGQTSNIYKQCLNDAGEGLPEAIKCNEDESDRQEARMNAAYKIAMRNVENKNTLKNKQRAWIKARDNECVLEDNQIAVLSYYECLVQKNAQRADKLEAIKPKN